MGGRITDVEGIPGRPELVYVATASGGLFKTINGGTTWTPIFDHEATISIGNIAVDPHNPDVVWLGSGEANARNSVSFGDGVYKTLDGGKTWRNLGLQGHPPHLARRPQSAQHQHRLRLRARATTPVPMKSAASS